MSNTYRGRIRRLRQVAGQALPQYGIEPVSISLLVDHLHNTTFKVIGSDGARYVLHILRTMADARSESQRQARVESELWWLDRVLADLELSVPVAVRTPGGAGVVRVAVEGGAPPWLCTLFRWIDGRFLDHRLTPSQLEAVGGVTAQLHHHSMQLCVPACFDRPIVDAADAETEEGLVRLFADNVSGAAADVIREVLQRVRRAQTELGSGTDTFGLIHADIHQKNYLFRGCNVGLIDFGDCGWGHYLYDLGVTVHQLRALPHCAELRVALLTGYRRLRDLSLSHEALIDPFVLLREVQDLAWLPPERDSPSYERWTAQAAQGVTMLEKLL